MKSYIAALVLALASTSTTGALAATFEQDTPEWERYWSQLRRHYKRVKTADVAYKPITSRSAYVGEIDPPFVTPDPDEVEVIAFVTYGYEAWISNYVLMTKWAKTLPSNAAVRYLPTKTLRQRNPRPRIQSLRTVRQNLYHTALAMGTPSGKAHHRIVRLLTGNLWTLESTQSQKRYARKLRLDHEQFQTMREHPGVRWEGQVADWLELAHLNEQWRLAKNVAGNTRKGIQTLYPELVIGGKYVISMSAKIDAKDTYRMANWAIGQELEDLESNRHWPRNAEQLAAWLANRDGQILSRWINGKRATEYPQGIVYDADAQAIWLIEANGGIENVARLTETEDGTHFVYEDFDGPRYFDPWRAARQFAPWTPADGSTDALRYGAFLLKDHLVARTEPLELKAQDSVWRIRFENEGRASVEQGSGPIEARWAIHGERLEVNLNAGETRTWPWKSVARRAGFPIPDQNVRPWDFTQRFAAIEPAVVGKPKTASALRLEEILNRIRRQTEMYRQRNKAAEARQEAREAAERLQSSHEER